MSAFLRSVSLSMASAAAIGFVLVVGPAPIANATPCGAPEANVDPPAAPPAVETEAVGYFKAIAHTPDS